MRRNSSPLDYCFQGPGEKSGGRGVGGYIKRVRPADSTKCSEESSVALRRSASPVGVIHSSQHQARIHGPGPPEILHFAGASSLSSPPTAFCHGRPPPPPRNKILATCLPSP
ncbi:unnamed protein product [Ixodes hexagonus]